MNSKSKQLKITNIEMVHLEEPEPVYCLTVDNDNHAFVLENGLVSHNCEGDSAAGGLKASRNSENQGLFPLRGKVISSFDRSEKKILENAEARDIATILGAGTGKDFNLDKVRYHKVFIATDADPDGDAISTGIFSLFWELFRPMIEDGRLYKIEPPLFIVSHGKGDSYKQVYCKNERERDEAIADLEKQKIKYHVSRLKGLGEMEAEDLASCLNPETRIVTQVTAPDVKATLEKLELLYGKDTEQRKEWIKTLEAEEDYV